MIDLTQVRQSAEVARGGGDGRAVPRRGRQAAPKDSGRGGQEDGRLGRREGQDRQERECGFDSTNFWLSIAADFTDYKQERRPSLRSPNVNDILS